MFFVLDSCVQSNKAEHYLYLSNLIVSVIFYVCKKVGVRDNIVL